MPPGEGAHCLCRVEPLYLLAKPEEASGQPVAEGGPGLWEGAGPGR